MKNVQSICLGCIVKNESKIIRRMFDSVKPFIDYWVIIDTGSTDNTVELIEEFKKEVPGEIHHSKFIHFEYNRNELLDLTKGKGDFTLLLDADMIFKAKQGNEKEHLKKLLNSKGFHMMQQNETISWWNWRIIYRNSDILWRYRSPTHEVLIPFKILDEEAKKFEGYHWENKDLPSTEFWIDDIGDGGCKSDKYTRDAKLLKDYIETEWIPFFKFHGYFYLGQTYFKLAQLSEDPIKVPKAKDPKNFQTVKSTVQNLKEEVEDPEELSEKDKYLAASITTLQEGLIFADKNHSDQEEYWAAHLFLGMAYFASEAHPLKLMNIYCRAHQIRPWRVEPITEIMKICNMNQQHFVALEFAFKAIDLEQSNTQGRLILKHKSGDYLLLREDYLNYVYWDQFLLCAALCNESATATLILREFETLNWKKWCPMPESVKITENRIQTLRALLKMDVISSEKPEK
jgi:glycosyltransferase involved in cell wall biosynthesis